MLLNLFSFLVLDVIEPYFNYLRFIVIKRKFWFYLEKMKTFGLYR